MSARTEDQLAIVAEQVEAAGRRAVVVPADLTDFERWPAWPRRPLSEFGRLDIVVNNVGGAMPRPFLDTSPGRLEQAFRFNVSTAPRPVPPAVPLMLQGATRRRRPSTSPRPWAAWRAAATWPTGPPRAPWPTTPGWPRPTCAPASGSTPSPSGRWPPRPSTSSCRPTSSGSPWRTATPLGASATPRTSPPPSSTWPPRPGRTSPARSSRSTAASSRPTSTWACPTSQPTTAIVTDRPRRTP